MGKGGRIDPWNRTESPEIDSHIRNQLIFNQDTKATHWIKKTNAEGSEYSRGEKNKINLDLCSLRRHELIIIN